MAGEKVLKTLLSQGDTIEMIGNHLCIYNKDWKPVPEVGMEYVCYDDGKISYSRQYKVLILQVIPFEKVNRWDKEAFLNNNFPNDEDQHYLFLKEPDYFVYAVSYEQRDRPMIEIFSRTRDGGWFGIGEVNFLI